MVAFLETHDGSNYTDSDLKRLDGTKKVPLGKQGVLASKLLLDPQANTVPTDGPNDLLYIAGGRDGLWVYQADTSVGVENKAWRVDDSGNTDPSSQLGLRWCTDVAIMKVAGVDYLLATFCKAGDSRLRVYELSKVRALAGNAEETGAEFQDLQVKVNAHPDADPSGVTRPIKYPGKMLGGAVAMAIAVDQDGSAGSETADVYLAMGHHGLVKVHFWSDAGVLKKQKTWGPIFGTGSAYQTTLTPPPGKTQALYGNFLYEHVRAYHDPGTSVRREEYPFVTDVEVLKGTVAGQAAHHLYVSVDHLHWMVFDLASSSAWAPDQPILAHIGEAFSFTESGAQETMHIVAADSAGATAGKANCARSLSVVHDPVEGTYVVVSSAWKDLITDYAVTDYGGPGVDAEIGISGGGVGAPCDEETWVYEVGWDGGAGAFTWDPRNDMPRGGEGVCAPAVQELLPERIKFIYHHDTDPDPKKLSRGLGLALFDLDLASGPNTQLFERTRDEIVGKYAVALGTAPEHPDLVLTGHNDGGVPDIGPYRLDYDAVKDEWKFVSLYSPPAGSTTDERGPSGLLWRHPASQSLVVPATGNDPEFLYLASGGRHPSPAPFEPAGRWTYQRFTGLDGVYASLERDMWRYLIPGTDRFDNPGRTYYESFDLLRGLTDLGATNQPMAGTNQTTAEGLILIWRTELDDALTDPSSDQNGDDIHVGFHPRINEITRLVTHPEFNWMPFTDDTKKWWVDDNPFNNDDDRHVVKTLNPTLVEVKDASGAAWGSYVLVVPCNMLNADPDWEVFTSGGPGNEGWLPPETSELSRYGHGFVQFWEIEEDSPGVYEPVTVTENFVPNNTPLERLVLPDGPQSGGERTSVLSAEAVRIGDHVYVILQELSGHVYAYEITNVLDTSTAHFTSPLATWTPPGRIFDGHEMPVFDLAVDYDGGSTALVYVALWQAGVHVLRFDPQDSTGLQQPFQSLGLIQTPGHASSVHVQTSSTGTRQLVVNDYDGGLRLFEAEEGE